MSKINRVVLFFSLFVMTVFSLYGQETDSIDTPEILNSAASRVSPEILLLELTGNFKSENLDHEHNMSSHYSMVSECIAALMENGGSSAYPALFSVLTADYPEIIASEAVGAMDIIDGNLLLFLSGIIENNPPEEKFIALRTGIGSQRLTVSERGQLSELALELSFSYTSEDDSDTYLEALRYMAINALADLQWKRASPLAIRHFYRVQADFLHGDASKENFLEAINCLGAVGDSDAALVLVLHLGLINARTQRSGIFDPQITMETIKALGNIGDNAAFDHLLYSSKLPYNEDINNAAIDAIARLKW